MFSCCAKTNLLCGYFSLCQTRDLQISFPKTKVTVDCFFAEKRELFSFLLYRKLSEWVRKLMCKYE